MFLGLGALSDRLILSLMETGHIRKAERANVNPASLDLSLSNDVFRIKSSASPVPGQSVLELLGRLGAVPVPKGSTLEPGTTFVARTNETFILPEGVYGYCNPKSSSGRDGFQIRVILDGVHGYDSLPSGKSETTGKPRNPWLLILPTVMPVRNLCFGETLSQVRFFTWDTRLSRQKMERLYRMHPLFFDNAGNPIPWDQVTCFDDGSLAVSLDLRPGTVVGWRCKENRETIDYSVTQPKEEYFDPIIPDRYGGVLLKKGSFSILGTDQQVLVPPEFACEVKAVSKRLANADIHAAGFVDPGWGYGTDGKGRGRRITLEVWAHEDWYIQPGQLIGELRYEQMIETPMVHYDQKGTSHYRHQEGALPSKRFV